MEEEITKLLSEKGPVTGAEIVGSLSQEPLLIWRTCRLSDQLIVRSVGRRYLRLDSEIEGFARLSPSILREFLTYSVIGLQRDRDIVALKAQEVAFHIRAVSRAKLDLAHHVFSAVLSRLENDMLLKERTCVLIAGDIVYGMAHDVPRPERSTGKLVKGSDMDLIVIVDDLFPRDLMDRMDEYIYEEKQKVLMAPHLREEIDYVVKTLDRVREQMAFDTFKRMVACKILEEGVFLYGQKGFFETMKSMLRDRGITERLINMEERAKTLRREAEAYLLTEDPAKIKDSGLSLFYPTEEAEEFE